MLDTKIGGVSQNENVKWKVFALLEKNKQGLVFKKGSEVLYQVHNENVSSHKINILLVWQDSRYQAGNFTVLDVDNDCVRMSKFIETKLKCKYEDGKAFYEVTENEEDLLYCKKILRPEKDKVFCRHTHTFNNFIPVCCSKLYAAQSQGIEIAVTH